MYTLHSDEVVSLISGDESVVYSCSPMQWMLHSTAIPAIIIIMCCYKTVDFYASKKTESQVDMKMAKRMTLFNIMINVSRNGIKAIMKNDPIKYLQKTRRKCGFRAHRQV